MNDGVVLLRRRRPVPHRAPSRHAVPRRVGRRPSTRRSSWCWRPRRERRALSVGVEGNAADVFPELLRPRHRYRHRHRPDFGPRPPQRLHPGRGGRRGGARAARQGPGLVRRGGPRLDGPPLRGHGRVQKAGAEVFDYGNNLRGEARLGGFADAFAYPGFVPAYIRPLFAEGKGPFRWVALSGDPADIAATDRAVADLFPDDRALHRWMRWPRSGWRFQGLPGPDLLARVRRAAPGRPGLQRAGAFRRGEGADRDRTGPPRLGLGGVALPGDRGDGRRLRRHRRLADPQRAAQHGVGSRLGGGPSRRRGRHRQVDPRRGPGGRRRHRPTGRSGWSGCSPTTRAPG